MTIFRDRADAGSRLGERLSRLGVAHDAVVLGLPRGGVPVARRVADALGAPLDVLVVRKIGAPFNPELALGAIASGGVTIYNDELLAELGIDESDLESVRLREQRELERRGRAYRGGRPPAALEGKTAVIVDDGMATGATMEAAVAAVRARAPREVVVAVPTSAADSVARLARVADRVVALETPAPYFGVGYWYADFPQLTDDEVVRALERAAEPGAEARGEPRRSA